MTINFRISGLKQDKSSIFFTVQHQQIQPGLSSGFWLGPEIWLRFCDFFSAGPLFAQKLGQQPFGGGVLPAATDAAAFAFPADDDDNDGGDDEDDGDADDDGAGDGQLGDEQQAWAGPDLQPLFQLLCM